MDNIKSKIHIMIIIVITLATMSTMLYLYPNSASGEKYLQLSNFIFSSNDTDMKNDKLFQIDDKILDEFLKVYSGKSIDNLEIFEKEEIRYILESMGKYNIDKLNKLLNSKTEEKEESIFKLLSENLFEEQLMILDEMMK